MPDSLAINLPSYLDNRIIYGYLKDDLVQRKEQPICYSQFCRIMNKDFPDVFIPKVTLSDIKVKCNVAHKVSLDHVVQLGL